jgi:lipopolysaccharide export system permease protein
MGGFWRGLTWFVGLFMAFVIVSGAQKVAQQKMSTSLVFLFILLQLPRIVVFTIPSSLLFGTVSTFTEMSGRGEVTALMAGGMSLRRMLRAPFVMSVLLAIFAFWLQETVVPQCELRRGQLGISALKSAKASDLFPRIDKDFEGNVKQEIRVQGFDLENLEMTRPYIWINQPDGSSLQITAQSAHWDEQQKAWVFVECTSRLLPSLTTAETGFPALPKTLQFHEQTFKDFALDPRKLGQTTRNQQDAFDAHTYEMVSLKDVWNYRNGLKQQLRQEQNAPAPDATKIKFLKTEVRATTFGIHDKFSVPLIVIAMVLVGAPLGVRPQRTASSGLALGMSLMVLLGYYLFWTLVSQWGKNGGQQPLIAAYLPFAVLLGIGLFLTWKKN